MKRSNRSHTLGTALILVGAVVAAMACGRGVESPTIAETYDPSVDMSWSTACSDGEGNVDYSIEYTRRGSRTLGIQTAYDMEIVFNARNSESLKRLRLLYWKADRVEHVVDDASEENHRISATASSIRIKGLIPLDAVTVKLLRTPDSGPEECVYQVGP